MTQAGTTAPTSPSTRIGVIGGGQLGLMLGEAARKLGLSDLVFYDPNPDSPARVIGAITIGTWNDVSSLRAFSHGCDVLTYEFENLSAEALIALEAERPIFPPIAALKTASDRLLEKQFFNTLGATTASHVAIDSTGDCESLAAQACLPGILKTRRLGYDGKGQKRVADIAALREAAAALGGQDLILERLVAFSREVSMVCARNRSGAMYFFPLTENDHVDGILHRSAVPVSDGGDRLRTQAVTIARQALSELSYVGVLAIEFFVVNGQLVVNEMAPRVHNSGHWTIEGSAMSQFEAHLRGILDLPFPAESAAQPAVMYNIVGTIPDLSPWQKRNHVFIHDYGKSPRPWRKLGHVTLLGRDDAALDDELIRARSPVEVAPKT